MRTTKLFSRTRYGELSNTPTMAHSLLLKGGFIRQVAPGLYILLPLGFKVWRKIRNIVWDVMEEHDVQNLQLPILQPKELWEESGRWDKYVLSKTIFETTERHTGSIFGLAPTAEEVITRLAKETIQSWRDLPIIWHQIGWKFRDEIRPRHGLLRGREFDMSDAYSFDASEEGMHRSFQLFREIYAEIFARVGLPDCISVQADSGAIGGQGSAEFMAISEEGGEGKFVTSRQIKERLAKELEVNVGLKIDFQDGDYYKVYGRGELHIAILLENMRREGFELQVSQPMVIVKEENGVKLEPFEEVTIDVPSAMSGVVIEKMAKRKGLMKEMNPEHAGLRLVFEIPVRGLLGYRNEFMVDTKGEGIISTHLAGFKPQAGEVSKSELGSMVSMASGKALAFSLWNLQERGQLYIGANTEVYEGMVIGNVAKGNDLDVNPIKGKQLTNMRASGADEAIRLTPPYEITLERGLAIMKEDEYLEVTPKNIRLRKMYLTKNERTKAGRK